MIAPTHSFISIFFGLVVLSFWDLSVGVWQVLAMVVFAWLPDLDSPGSTIGRALYFISRRINYSFGHRGFVHSLPFFALLAALTSPAFFLWGEKVYSFVLILWIAWLSHIIADCFTVSGVRLLYPSPTVYVFPKNELFRFNTGNLRVESVISLVFIFLSLVYFFAVVRSDGLISFLRIKFAQPGMAGDQFTSFEGFRYLADATIYDKSARSEIKLSDIEVLYTDKTKLIVRQGTNIASYAEGDLFELKKVSLKKSERKFEVLTVSNFQISEDLSKTNAVAAVGVISPAVPLHFENVSENGGALKLFYVPMTVFQEARRTMKEENEKALDEVARLEASTGEMKARSLLAQIAALSEQSGIYLAKLNSASSITEQLKLSATIRQIETKQDALRLEMMAIDRSGDPRVLEKINEAKKKMVTNLFFSGVLIK